MLKHIYVTRTECDRNCFVLQVPPGTPVVNALSKQRAMLENILRACVGLAPENNMILEYMSLSSERRREEMARFLSSGRSVQSDIMVASLRGMILSASA